MSVQRVVITGLGCVTPIGIGVQAFRENLFAGRDGMHSVQPIVEAALLATAPGTTPNDLRFTRAACVTGFDPTAQLSPSQMQIADRSVQMALVAAAEAIAQSGLLAAQSDENTGTAIQDRTAIVFGCSAGGRSSEEIETARLYTRGARVHPLTVPRVMASAAR
jgi:nodulation protein E